MNVREALKDAIARLRAADVPSSALAAELLLMHALGRDRAWLYSRPEASLEPSVAKTYFDLVSERIRGIPTQYLTGKQEFWGLEFEVTPAVLIPRPETEHVIEVCLERLGPEGRAEALRIADVGTGSGCIAVALARELPQAAVFATDISAAALEVARRNALRHGVAERIQFIEGNLLDPFLTAWPDSTGEPFNLLASNPPYIGREESAALPREVRDHEPAEALFAGEEGTWIYAPLIAQAAKLLCAGGWIVLEMGCGGPECVQALFQDCRDWSDTRVTHDLAGIPRVCSARRARAGRLGPS